MQKPLGDFGKYAKSPDGLQYYCKSCKAKAYQDRKSESIEKTQEARRRRVHRNRKMVYRYLLDNPCVSCGIGDPVVLEFDHRDNVSKDSDISKMVNNGLSEKKIMAEIAKCDVRCANCHKRRTAEQFGWWKFTNNVYVQTESEVGSGYMAVVDWPNWVW